MTNLWHRLFVPYSQWPWRLVALEDNRLDDDERGMISRSFFHANTCCLDKGFSQPLQGVLETHSCLLGQGKYSNIPKALSIQKVTNSEIENNFARALSASRCARGTLASLFRKSVVSYLDHLLLYVYVTVYQPASNCNIFIESFCIRKTTQRPWFGMAYPVYL